MAASVIAAVHPAASRTERQQEFARYMWRGDGAEYELSGVLAALIRIG
jgi:hypothetical protein